MTRKIAIILLLLLIPLTSGCDRNVLAQLSQTHEWPEVTAIRLATDMPALSAGYRQLERFQQLVAERSQGGMVVRLYPQGAWSADESLLDYQATGALEMVCLSTTQLSRVVPQYAIYDLPCLFADVTAVQGYAEGQQGREALDLLAQADCYGLGFAAGGYDYFQQTKGPALTLDHWAGLWMAAPATTAYSQGLLPLGITAVAEGDSLANSRALGEGSLRLLLQQKAVNESSYLNDPQLFYRLSVATADSAWWQGLEEGQQRLLAQCWQEALSEEIAYQGQTMAQIFTDGGIQLDPLSPALKQAIYSIVRPVAESQLAASGSSLSRHFYTAPLANDPLSQGGTTR